MLVPPSLVPGFDRLAVAHQGGKALCRDRRRFPPTPSRDVQTRSCVGIAVLHVAVVFQLATGNALAVAQEIQRPELAFGRPAR